MPAESRRTPPRGPRPGPRPGPRRSGGTSRSTRPPAAAARPTGPAATAAVRPRRSRFTGRAAVLLLVLSLLTISYASSLRAYLQQRGHIEELQGQIALREARIDDLEQEKQRWSDPAYVRKQARELNFVAPGETAYVVLDDGKLVQAESKLTDPATLKKKQPKGWWSHAWASVELAGNPPKPKPAPATRITDPAGD